MSLVTRPDLPALLNTTLISPFSPGAIGSLGQSGMVHPQEALQLDITKSLSPVFSNLKVCSTLSPSVITPKS